MGRWIPDNFGSKSYKSVPSSSIQPTQKKPQESFTTNYKLDFTQASKDYWAKKVSESQGEYNKGTTAGKFGKYLPDLDDFLDRIFILIKDGITTEMVKKGYTTEQLQHQFSAIETSFKILAETIKNLDTEKKVNVDSLMAFLHGFVNGYMENFTDIKEKQT